MKPERILVVSHCMDRNGAETLIMNIYRNLDREKVQFDFLLHCNYKSDYEEEIESLGGRIFKVPSYNIINHFSYVRTLDRFFSEHPEFRIVHGHLFNKILYLKVARKHNLVTICHSHASTNGTGLQALVLDFLHRNVNRYTTYRFACSEQAGRWLYGKNAEFRVIPNGIDTQRFRFSIESRERIREEFGIGSDATVLGHVGRFHPVKNHPFLLEVFADYLKTHPSAVLMLVGDGPLRQSMQEKAGQYGIENSVVFTGSRPDTPALLCAMDCFVFTSLNEGLPVTLVEAQCSGLPCIVPDHITQEVEVTDLLVRIPLHEGAEKWAESIGLAETENRETYPGKVAEGGFDIRKTALDLQDFYLRIAGGTDR